MDSEQGRRERKKAATRRNIATTARQLFFDRGYESVGIRDVATAADVAVTTVFAHFTCKEALVFEHDHQFELQLAHAVLNRSAEIPIVTALHHEIQAMLRHCTSPDAAPLWTMIDGNDDLLAYEMRMRSRHADTLALAISNTEGLEHPTIACRALARFTLDSFDIARTTEDPLATAAQVFEMIDTAWQTRPTRSA